jgi:hypothetical protein
MDTLRLVSEAKFSNLFPQAKGHQEVLEASSVVLMNSSAYAICDSSWTIYKFDYNNLDSAGVQLGDPVRKNFADSSYEAIMYDRGIVFAIRESVKRSKEYHAIIEEIQINPSSAGYTVLDSCKCDFSLKAHPRVLREQKHSMG